MHFNSQLCRTITSFFTPFCPFILILGLDDFLFVDTKIHAEYNTIITIMLMMSNTALKSVSSLSAHSSSSLLLRRAGRKISSRSRKSTTFYKTTTTKAFASSEGGEGKEEEEWAAMGSNAKSNVVPRRPQPQLAGTNAPEYMHGVLAFNRFYPENARGDTFNRHLLVALVR